MKIENYDNENFERNDDVVHEKGDDIFGRRVFPYIAMPMQTTIAQESGLLSWAKDWSEPEIWLNDNGDESKNDRFYRVYQLRVKEEYMHFIDEELHELGGFYLSRK